jgi:hypothetical protein
VSTQVSREQQEQLDPILGQATGRSPGTADLVMAAYALGREHGGDDGGRCRNALAWVRHVAGLHYLGGAFNPEHMRDLANTATAALQGKALPDYAQAMEEGRMKAAEWAALFGTWADGVEDDAGDGGDTAP